MHQARYSCRTLGWSLSACLAVIVVGLGCAAPGSAETLTQLRGVAGRLVAAGVPGAIVQVDDGRTVLAASAGSANLEDHDPAHAGDAFRIGSISKTFVATLMLQLSGQRRLRLSDAVGRWVTHLPTAWRRITLAELLRMRSGIPNYTPAWAGALLAGQRAPSYPYTPRALLDFVAREPLTAPSGTRFSDTNTNYVLLGLVAQRVTHESLASLLEQRFIRPLRLHHTSLDLGTLRGEYLHGYETFSRAIGPPGPDGRIDMQPVSGTGYDTGAIVSSVGDLDRFLRALLDGRLLRPAQLRSMQHLLPASFAPGPTPPPFSPSYWGLGLEGTRTRCGAVYGAAGGILGYASVMVGTRRGGRIVTLGVNEFESLPNIVPILQREVLGLLCPR